MFDKSSLVSNKSAGHERRDSYRLRLFLQNPTVRDRLFYLISGTNARFVLFLNNHAETDVENTLIRIVSFA